MCLWYDWQKIKKIIGLVKVVVVVLLVSGDIVTFG